MSEAAAEEFLCWSRMHPDGVLETKLLELRGLARYLPRDRRRFKCRGLPKPSRKPSPKAPAVPRPVPMPRSVQRQQAWTARVTDLRLLGLL